MAKKETVHDIVFNVYHLTNASKERKEKVRKYINRKLYSEYQDKEWNELSGLEKDTFIYITIRQKMLSKYVDDNFHNKVNERIDSYLKETLINSDSDIKKHNSIIEAIYENYFNPDDDDSSKKEKYNLLCIAIHNFNTHVPVPSYDEWCNHPLRPYDYIAGFEDKIMQVDLDAVYPSQTDIDHVIIQILMKEYTAQTKRAIDVPKIYECLNYIMNYEIDNYDIVQDEYDPKIEIPKEEQEKYVQANRKYFTYKRMLEDLTFVR